VQKNNGLIGYGKRRKRGNSEGFIYKTFHISKLTYKNKMPMEKSKTNTIESISKEN